MSTNGVVVIAFDHATKQFIAKGTRWNTSLTWDKAYTIAPVTFRDIAPALPNGCLGLVPGAHKWPERVVQAWLDNGYRVVWVGAYNRPTAVVNWTVDMITAALSRHLTTETTPF